MDEITVSGDTLTLVGKTGGCAEAEVDVVMSGHSPFGAQACPFGQHPPPSDAGHVK